MSGGGAESTPPSSASSTEEEPIDRHSMLNELNRQMEMVKSLQMKLQKMEKNTSKPPAKRARTVRRSPRRSPRRHARRSNENDESSGKRRRSPRRALRRSSENDESPGKRRRSPRRALGRSSENDESESPKIKRKLSWSSPRTRTPKQRPLQRVRKILGAVIKSNLDANIRSGIYRDLATRKFMLDTFEDDVRSLIDKIIDSEDCDTEMVTRQQLFRIAVDIAKKRERYVPRGKKKKSPAKKQETVDLTLSVSKVAAKVVAAAAVVKKDPEEASPSKKNSDDKPPNSKDSADLHNELLKYDQQAQKMRTDLKDNLDDGKKKSTTAKKKKKTTKKKKPSTNKRSVTNERGEVLRVGMKVQGKWKGKENYGEWFDGVVLAVDSKKNTIHIKYEDGDEDVALSWHDVSII